MLSLMQEFSPAVEYYSIDEVFFLCWFSLIWKNSAVELAGNGQGRTFTLPPLYRSGIRKLRVPLLCSRLSLQKTAEAIRARILQAVGVPATVGIARSRTLSKLISDTAKPFGALAILDPEALKNMQPVSCWERC